MTMMRKSSSSHRPQSDAPAGIWPFLLLALVFALVLAIAWYYLGDVQDAFSLGAEYAMPDVRWSCQDLAQADAWQCFVTVELPQPAPRIFVFAIESPLLIDLDGAPCIAPAPDVLTVCFEALFWLPECNWHVAEFRILLPLEGEEKWKPPWYTEELRRHCVALPLAVSDG
jgi:hypothetical protein